MTANVSGRAGLGLNVLRSSRAWFFGPDLGSTTESHLNLISYIEDTRFPPDIYNKLQTTTKQATAITHW